jgi:hypothetical protein
MIVWSSNTILYKGESNMSKLISLMILLVLLVPMVVTAIPEVSGDEPIVDPGVWMQIQKADGVRTFYGLLIAACIVVFMVVVSVGLASLLADEYLVGIICIISAVGCLITAFIIGWQLIDMPTSDTVLKQVVTQQLTPNNIDATKKTIAEVVDYIIQAVKTLKQ